MTKKNYQQKLELKFKLLNDKAQLPEYATDGSSGMDVRSTASVSIGPGASVMIPTGLASVMPNGWEIQVRPRSGLAAKYRVTVLNAPGTVDSDYIGEIKVILINHGDVPFTVNEGDRIAQFVFAKVYRPEISETDELPDTKRNTGGFGSTGVA